MPTGFLAALVAFGLGMLLGAAAGAAGAVWGHETARTFRLRTARMSYHRRPRRTERADSLPEGKR